MILNPKKKLFQIIIITLSISSLLYIITKKKITKKPEIKLRKNENLNIINYICSQSNDDLLPLYQKISFQYNENIFSIFSKSLIDYIITKDTKYLKENYLKRVSRFLGILLIIIIVIISYFICWICCCCPCCCCKQKNEENCCRQFSLLIAIIMSGTLISSGYYGMNMEYKIMGSINGMTCTVYKFIKNVFEGDECYEKPIWSGFSHIINSIVNIDKIILNSYSKNDKIIDNINDIKNLSFYQYIMQNEKFLNDEKSKYEDLYKINFINPDPFNSENVFPDFIYEMPNLLKDIIFDFEYSIVHPFKVLNDISEYINVIYSNKDNISNSLKNSLEKLNKFKQTFDYFAYDAIVNKIKYQKYINKYGNAFFSFFFPVCISIGSINIFCLLFYVTFNLQWTRIPMYVLWNIETLIMIISFIFGLLFSLIYLEGKDGRDIIDYALSSYNLNNKNTIIFKGEGKEYLNICFNENGDLLNKLNLLNNNTILIDKLYDYILIIETQIKIVSNEFDNLKKHINNFENYYDYIDNSYYYINGEKYEFKNILIELRKYSDSGYEGNYLKKNNEIFDVWVFSKKNCPKGYKYISNSDNYILQKRNCLLFNERKNLSSYYNNIVINKGKYNNLQEAFESYNKTIFSYIEKNQEILKNNILPYFNEYYNNLTLLKNKIESNLNEIYSSISQLKNLYGKYIKNNESIFSFVNCRFMRRDINLFLFQMDKLSENSGKLASINYTVSFALMLCNLFFFFVIMRYLKEKRKIDIDDIVNDNYLDKSIPIPDNQSENKQIEDLINNQNRNSFNHDSIN